MISVDKKHFNILEYVAEAAFLWRKNGGWEEISFDGSKYQRFSCPNMTSRDLLKALLKLEAFLERRNDG